MSVFFFLAYSLLSYIHSVVGRRIILLKGSGTLGEIPSNLENHAATLLEEGVGGCLLPTQVIVSSPKTKYSRIGA